MMVTSLFLCALEHVIEMTTIQFRAFLEAQHEAVHDVHAQRPAPCSHRLPDGLHGRGLSHTRMAYDKKGVAMEGVRGCPCFFVKQIIVKYTTPSILSHCEVIGNIQHLPIRLSNHHSSSKYSTSHDT